MTDETVERQGNFNHCMSVHNGTGAFMHQRMQSRRRRDANLERHE